MVNVSSNNENYINEAFSGYAEAYYQREILDPRMPLAVQMFVKELPLFGMVEDWGCGPGHWSVETHKRQNTLQFRLIDVAEGMLSKAKSLFPQATFESQDVRLWKPPVESVCAVIMGYLIPYLNEAEMTDLLTNAVLALLPGGCLMLAYMSLPTYKSFRQSSSDGQYELQMNYHSRLYVSELLANSGMRCLYRDVMEKHDHQDLIEIWKKPKH